MDRAGVHHHDPRKGDNVWVRSRQEAGKQPNGKIVQVWKEDEEVWVDFEKNQDGTRDRNVTIGFNQLHGAYTNSIFGFMVE